jgi:hypothetical protein
VPGERPAAAAIRGVSDSGAVIGAVADTSSARGEYWRNRSDLGVLVAATILEPCG